MRLNRDLAPHTIIVTNDTEWLAAFSTATRVPRMFGLLKTRGSRDKSWAAECNRLSSNDLHCHLICKKVETLWNQQILESTFQINPDVGYQMKYCKLSAVRTSEMHSWPVPGRRRDEQPKLLSSGYRLPSTRFQSKLDDAWACDVARFHNQELHNL